MLELSVILVSFNDWIHLEKCLQSLLAVLPEKNMEVVVVDNNSSDGSPGFVKDRFPEVKLILNENNLGFAKACNLGIHASSGEFVLFLNNDTIVNVQALSVLLDKIRENPLIGAVGPALLSGKKKLSGLLRKKS